MNEQLYKPYWRAYYRAFDCKIGTVFSGRPETIGVLTQRLHEWRKQYSFDFWLEPI